MPASPLPRFPVYVPSKSRARTATTPGVLARMGVPYKIIVEEHQYAEYKAEYGADRLLVLPQEYISTYDTLTDVPEGEPKGSGPPRNFAWDHSVSEGHAWHWILDDNIRSIMHYTRNEIRRYGDATGLVAMEDFALRYTNLGACGPEYDKFIAARQRYAHPYRVNHKVFSCFLLRNDTGCRWRGRWNEDLLLCISLLKKAWCTVTFLAILQEKTTTQKMRGGLTADFYQSEGTYRKTMLAVKEHPDMITPVWKYSRWHHKADFSQFRDMKLIRDPAWEPPAENPYETVRQPRARFDRRAVR